MTDVEKAHQIVNIRAVMAEAERDALRAQVTDYETKLTAVMPLDFKDWHQNNKAEWPEVAAWVIANLRQQRDELAKDTERYRFLRDNLASKSANSVDDFIALEPMTGDYFDAHIDILMSEFFGTQQRAAA